MVEGSISLWFRFFEPVAVAIAFIAVIQMIRTYRMLGGGLRRGYGILILGTTLVGLSMVWKAIVEAGWIVEGLASEVILELFIIGGLVVIALSSKIIANTINNGNNGQ